LEENNLFLNKLDYYKAIFSFSKIYKLYLRGVEAKLLLRNILSSSGTRGGVFEDDLGLENSFWSP